jgi:hypothetical protein
MGVPHTSALFAGYFCAKPLNDAAVSLSYQPQLHCAQVGEIAGIAFGEKIGQREG